MADQIELVIGEINKVTETVVKHLTLEVTANLIEATPVDTGWARANWVPAIGTPALTPSTPSNKDDRRQASTQAKAKQASGTASIHGYKLQRGLVHVSNGVPYISRLNDGSSIQAPTAFVQRSVLKAVRTVSQRKF